MTAVALAACAVGAAAALLAPLVVPDSAEPPRPWHVVGLLHQSKPFTRYTAAEIDGIRVLRVEADRSYGNLVHSLQATAAHTLAWRWRVDRPVIGADLRTRSGDDSAIEVCAMFDLPLSQVPFVERQVLRLTRSATGEALPSAMLCYVWDTHFAPGTVLPNAFTRRMRMIVLQGEGAPLGQWRSERRDLKADFLRAFGDEAQEMPPLIAVGLSADGDSTQSYSVAFIDALVLE